MRAGQGKYHTMLLGPALTHNHKCADGLIPARFFGHLKYGHLPSATRVGRSEFLLLCLFSSTHPHIIRASRPLIVIYIFEYPGYTFWIQHDTERMHSTLRIQRVSWMHKKRRLVGWKWHFRANQRYRGSGPHSPQKCTEVRGIISCTGVRAIV